METYIQVAGLGDLIETVVEQRATVTITVKASKTEVALAEATGLRNDAIRILQDAGLKPDEIREGGRDTWQPWYSRRGVGQEAAHRVLLACRETRRLYRALDALEPLFTNSRYSMNVDMQQPRFEAMEGAETEARMTAIRHARDKAQVLAKEAGVALGAVAQVEELGSQSDNSGAYGDHTWAFAGGAAAMASAPANEFEELAGATRVRTLRYRIRFLIG